MELTDIIIQKWGVAGIAIFFILDKIGHWAWGSTWKWIKAVDNNTEALKELQVKVEVMDTNILKFQTDLRTAFHNLREVRESLGLGPLSRPIDQ